MRPVTTFCFHLIIAARKSDGDLMRKYVCEAVLYSGAFDPFGKKGWARIEEGIGDLDATANRIEKDRRRTGSLLNCVTWAT